MNIVTAILALGAFLFAIIVLAGGSLLGMKGPDLLAVAVIFLAVCILLVGIVGPLVIRKGE